VEPASASRIRARGASLFVRCAEAYAGSCRWCQSLTPLKPGFLIPSLSAAVQIGLYPLSSGRTVFQIESLPLSVIHPWASHLGNVFQAIPPSALADSHSSLGKFLVEESGALPYP